MLHIVVEGRAFTGTVADPCTAPPIPPGRLPNAQGQPGAWPPDRQVSCYWPAHKPLFDVGVDGWWPDQGDGYDPISRLARIRMYWEGSRMFRPNERPYALHRNGYPGMQRYGAFLWSGDVYSTWETLKTHVPVAVNTGLSGIPFWGTDIGGFVPTPEYTGELHVRWFQFGAFSPLFRAHGRTWHLRLPWGWNRGTVGISEVAGYGGGAGDPAPEHLHNDRVEPICREVSRAALPADAVPLLRRARMRRDGHADHARAVAALSGRRDGRRARRSVPLGPRHPRRAGRREGRDVADALSAARRVVRLLDERASWKAAARSPGRSIWRRCRSTCAPARSSRWDR